ncbi:MAG: hypothetical protein WBW32_07840 [Luteibacter sp.]
MSAKLRKMTHEEAVAEVYRLTPQLREYDEFMYLGVRWLPYTMFFHLTDYRSAVINTDAFGFRRNSVESGGHSIAAFPHDLVVNLVVGGSTALGTGTTSDASTVSSWLCERTGELWLNFAGRGYNSTQELVLFLMHQHRFKRIGHVILLSGANTLTLEGLPDELATEHGRYYYSYEFGHYMEQYNDDLRRRKNSYASAVSGRDGSMLARLKKRFGGSGPDINPADTVITDEGIDRDQRVDRAIFSVLNALGQWQALLAPSGAKLSYALQPVSRWTKDSFHDEEEEMFHAIDCCANNFWRMFGSLLGPEVYARYKRGIEEGCRTLGVPFLDVNAALGASPVAQENIFVDHLHFNDAGYIETARLLHDAFVADPTARINEPALENA